MSYIIPVVRNWIRVKFDRNEFRMGVAIGIFYVPGWYVGEDVYKGHLCIMLGLWYLKFYFNHIKVKRP